MENKRITSGLKVYAGRAVLWLLLMGFSIHTGAQSPYLHKGFVFKHPYFEGKTWLSSQKTVDIVAAPRFLNSNPSSISFTGTSKKSATVYISGDSLYLSVSTLTEKSDICGKNEIAFIAPRHVILPIVISSNSLLYAFKRQAVDTVLVCLNNQDNIIFLLKVNTSSQSIISLDSIKLSLLSGTNIKSMNGSSGRFPNNDTGIWITGSNGLLRFIPYSQNQLQKDSIFDLASDETILFYGDGYAATQSGKIFKRNVNKFELVSSFTRALRYVNAKGAVGDGLVIVHNANKWESVYSGTNSFKECNFTANASGVLCEVIGNTWKCDSIQDGNLPTEIQSIKPAKFMQIMNNGIVYKFADTKPETLSISLKDPEKNYQPPSVTHKSRQIKTELLHDGNYLLQNADPSQTCIEGRLSLADSVLKVILNPIDISVMASAKLGVMDLVCEECMLKDYAFHKSINWAIGDSIFIKTQSQNVKIVNGQGVTFTINNFDNVNDTYLLQVISGKCNSLVKIPCDPIKIEKVMAFNLQGKMIPIQFAGNSLKIDNLNHQIIILRIHLLNGIVMNVNAIINAK